jgi:hypothetical protein
VSFVKKRGQSGQRIANLDLPRLKKIPGDAIVSPLFWPNRVKVPIASMKNLGVKQASVKLLSYDRQRVFIRV